MPLKRLASPLIVIIAGVILTIIVVVAPDSDTSARPRSQPNYPPPTLTALAAQVATTDPYPGPTGSAATATPSVTVTPNATSATPSATQSTPTESTLQSTEPVRPPPLPPTATANDVEALPPLEESTPTPESKLVCTSGEPVEIAGQGPPRAAFLLYFGQRVVSGGSVSVDGHFSIKLVVGHERPGAYLVTVRIRGTRVVLRELTCEVPAPPSPTPIKGRPAR
ncbi:MAG: hypothetical protein ACJ8CR_07910 [Roseiflexaceae bacterium]